MAALVLQVALISSYYCAFLFSGAGVRRCTLYTLYFIYRYISPFELDERVAARIVCDAQLRQGRAPGRTSRRDNVRRDALHVHALRHRRNERHFAIKRMARSGTC